MIDRKENELINCKLRTLYKQYQEEFLDVWEATRRTDTTVSRPYRLNEFGIVDVSRYDAEGGILFVGKELNGWKDEDLRAGWSFLHWIQSIASAQRFPKTASVNMWYNIGRWAMLLVKPQESLSYLAACKTEALAQIGTIAYTNINKVWGYARADGGFNTLARNDLVLSVLRREIEIIAPKIIVCCGTAAYVKRAIPNYKGVLIGMPHPAARMGKIKMLEQLRGQL